VSRYLLRRVIEAIPLLLLISIAVFAVLQLLPAGPLSIYENEPSMTEADLQRLREHYGLNDPIPVRYAKWLFTLVHGDLGFSLVTQQPVVRMIADRLPNTLWLVAISLGLALLIAIPLGVISAVRQYSWLDHTVTLFGFVGYATPPFWSGLLAIIVFAVQFKEWGLPALPASGMVTLGAGGGGLPDRLVHLVLPVGVLALFNTAHYMRYVRASMLEVIQQDYVRTARSKGLPERPVILIHALKNAALPLVTIVTLDLPALFSGALVTESIFAWPGMGRLFLESAFRFDYAVLMGIVIITGLLVVLSMLLADVLYAWLDPRIRYA
jgi:peptide/nickel transport system permease protein